MARRIKTKHNWTPQEKIALFKERVDGLKSTKLVASGFDTTSTIIWDEDKEPSVKLPNIDNDELRSFLAVFRHFISNSEPIYLYNIFQICLQYLTNYTLKNHLIDARKKWKLSLEHNGIQFNLNNK